MVHPITDTRLAATLNNIRHPLGSSIYFWQLEENHVQGGEKKESTYLTAESYGLEIFQID